MTGDDEGNLPMLRTNRGLSPLDERNLAPEVRAFADYLRALRARAGLTSQRLESELGMPAASLSRYLSGERLPRLEWLKGFQGWLEKNVDGGLTETERKTGRNLLYAAGRVKNILVANEIEVDGLDQAWSARIEELERSIERLRSQVAEERVSRQRFEQHLGEAGQRDAEESRARLASLEERLSDQEALLTLLQAQREDIGSMVLKSAIAVAARDQIGTVLVPSRAGPGLSRQPSDIAAHVCALAAEGHIEEADRLLVTEAAHRESPRELLQIFACLRAADEPGLSKVILESIGRYTPVDRLAQVFAIRAQRVNEDLMGFAPGRDIHADRVTIRTDDEVLMIGIAARQDDEIVKFVEMLPAKRLRHRSGEFISTAYYARNRKGRNALVTRLRAAGFGVEVDKLLKG